MSLPKQVRIIEVSPRDGLQSEPRHLTTDQKVELINELSDCGFSQIEIGSFVSAEHIPQLADTEAVFEQINLSHTVDYSALICNQIGLDRAITCGIGHIALFTSASESFCQKNIQTSINGSLKTFKQIIQKAHDEQFIIRVYLSCAFDCPFEGTIKAQNVVPLVKYFYNLKCDEIVLADTTGRATPLAVQQLIELCRNSVPVEYIGVHFHDTYGMASANIFSALESGVQQIDSSIAGLGGCPFAPGASGNIATEDLLYMLHSMNIATGINLQKTVSIGNKVSAWLHRKNQSRISALMLH